jgi:hypothetical protein
MENHCLLFTYCFWNAIMLAGNVLWIKLSTWDYYSKHKYWNDGEGDEDEDADGDKWEGLLELANKATFARVPDITNIKGYQGNDGGPEERWYYATAIVFLQLRKVVTVETKGGPEC